MAVALDANVLLRLAQKQHPLFPVARRAVLKLEVEGETVCYVSQNVVEFWNVTDAARELLPDTPEVHAEWRKIVVEVSVSGVQVHDARIAACLRVHGVTRLLRFNTKDFVRYSGFAAVDPAQV